MSETLANQCGISTDLLSLSLTVHPSVSISAAVLLFSVSWMLLSAPVTIKRSLAGICFRKQKATSRKKSK